MLYKFKSKVAGDVIMTAPVGDRVMRLLGRDPAPQGIVLPDHMPTAIASLERAVQAEEAEQQRQDEQARAEGHTPLTREGITLRQRVWPLIEMMRRSQAAGAEIVWGV